MVVFLFVGVHSNSHKFVGIAVKIAVSFETKYRIPQMCSFTILGLRPIENLKARKELVIRCTKKRVSIRFVSGCMNDS